MDNQDFTEKELQEMKEAKIALMTEVYIPKCKDARFRELYNIIINRRYFDKICADFETVGLQVNANTRLDIETVWLSPENAEDTRGERWSKRKSVMYAVLYQEFITNRTKVTMSVLPSLSIRDIVTSVNVYISQRNMMKLQEACDILWDIQEANFIKIDAKSRNAMREDTIVHILPSLAIFFNEEKIDTLNDRLAAWQQESGNLAGKDEEVEAAS